MRTLSSVVFILGIVTGGGTGYAQNQLATQAPALADADAIARQEELEKWIHDFSEWKEWAAQWANRREPGWFKSFRERRERPDPPAWLSDWCGSLLESTGATAEACALLDEWRADYATALAAAARATTTAGKEDEHKTIWWEHIHLDAGWPALQSGVALYGVVGVHATMTVRGRLSIFVAPGAMLLNVPTSDGARAWKLATNYGVAYRLGQFSTPGNRRALLHLNLAKAWLLSAGPDVPTKSTDFIGFSVTFKKTR